MLRKLLLTLVAMMSVATLQAAVYTWSRYNLTFEVPDDGFVTYSSNTRFEIQWDDMVMTIHLYNKDKSDDKFLRENLRRKALNYSMYDLKDGKSKVKGFKGLNIMGTMPDGSRAIIADLVSKHQNLIVEVTVNYLFGNRETVEDMIKSFAENKTQTPNHERKRQKVQTKQKAKQQQQKDKKQQEKPQPARKEKLYDA